MAESKLRRRPLSSKPKPEVSEQPGELGACSAVYNDKLYMYGVSSTKICVFDFTECKWSTFKTKGNFPRALSGSCATVIADCFYLFGGWFVKNSDIHKLNLATLTWKRLTEKGMKGRPMDKDKAGMVDYGEEMLCVTGGYGDLPDDFVRQRGASYHLDPSEMMHWTNELHLFHIKTCESVREK